ncbi:MAG TPA: hypothetical protein VMT20_01305 [Terriglobia bacterium]|nr:hypothetical protein [Terriglobia bacterium]
MYLILAFILGLAAVLISIGLITVYARRLPARVRSDGPGINRGLPTLQAGVVMCLGVAITLQGLNAMRALHAMPLAGWGSSVRLSTFNVRL